MRMHTVRISQATTQKLENDAQKCPWRHSKERMELLKNSYDHWTLMHRTSKGCSGGKVDGAKVINV